MVVGILILVAAALFIYFQDVVSENVEEQELVTLSGIQLGDNIQSYVENCIAKTGKEAVIYIGNHGGYYDVPTPFDPLFTLPYYFYEEQDLVPDEETVNKELGKYMDDMLFFCLQNFNTFTEQGYEIDMEDIETDVDLQKGKVRFFVKLPLYFSKGTIGKELALFESDVSTDLKVMHELTELFMEEQVTFPDSICLSCLLNWSLERDLRVGMYKVDNETVLFEIINDDSNEIVTLQFLNKYPLQEGDTNEI